MSLGGAFEVLSYAVYVRTSIILARIAAAQSGRQLPTLSGRAIPGPVGVGEDELDECRKSLLGSIVGVTAEIEKSRNVARSLASTGSVQRSVGVIPGNINDRGQLDNPAAKAANAAQTAKSRKKAQPQKNAKQAASAPSSISGASNANMSRKARKLAKAQNAPQAIKSNAPSTAKATDTASNATSSSNRPPPPAAKSATYINLDSESEPEFAPARAKPDVVESNSSDSRYAVKKARNTNKAAGDKFEPVGADGNVNAAGTSGSDSDVIFVASTAKSQQEKVASTAKSQQDKGKAAERESSSRSTSNVSSSERTIRSSKKNAPTATSSDMDMSDSAPSEEKAESKKSAQTVTGREKPTSPHHNKLKLAQRKEFWSSKGQVDSHQANSDSESDTVYVRSK